MQFGIDDAAVALAANDGVVLFHFGNNVQLAHCRRLITAARLLGNVAKCAARRQVADSIAVMMLQNVISNGYKRVFLAKHFAVLLHYRKPINIGVNSKTNVSLLRLDSLRKRDEILFQRLGIVSKIAVCIVIDDSEIVDSQCFEEFWNGNATHRIDGIDADREIGFLDGIDVHQWQRQHLINMYVLKIFDSLNLSKIHNVHKISILFGIDGIVDDKLAVLSVEELAIMVEQFEGVPLRGIVARGQDDATVGIELRNGDFGGRSGCKTYINHVNTTKCKCANYDIAHIRTRNPRVATHNYLIFRLL